MTALEIAQLKMRLIEAQTGILQYQARDVQAEIARLTTEKEQHGNVPA